MLTYFLITYDRAQHKLLSALDLQADRTQALAQYEAQADFYADESHVEVSLIRAPSADALRRGHPQYFGVAKRTGRQRTFRACGSVVKWAFATILGGILVLYISPDRLADWVRWHVDHRSLAGEPSCGEPAWYRSVNVQQAHPWNEPMPQEHSGQDTRDDDPRTAWIQYFPSRYGHDYIVWTLAKPSRVKLVCVMNGWASNNLTAQQAGQLKTVTVTGRLRKRDRNGRGCRTEYTLPPVGTNFGSFDTIHFSCKADEIKLAIESVYPATTDESLARKSVAISDVRIYG